MPRPPGDSQLRTVLDRGHLIVGTGSTNAPWHFEDDQGKLTGMDIAMARILAKGLFDDETKVEFVLQDPAARIPNVITGKVDITIQFMTVSPSRAQLVNFSRPYYIEGVALLSKPGSPREKWEALQAGGADTKISILQNVDAEASVHKVLPEAQVLQLDTQANVIQALEAGRADAAAVDLSTVWWLAKRQPDKYADAGFSWNSMLYSAALRQGDLDWLQFVDTTLQRGDVRPPERHLRPGRRRVLRPEAAGAATACPSPRFRGWRLGAVRIGEVELPLQLHPDLAQFRQARLGARAVA